MSSFLVSAMPELRKTQIIKTGSQSSSIQLQDRTETSRVGFRGPAAETFLKSKGFSIPSLPNQSLLSNGVRVVRLSKFEFWLIDEKQQHSDVILDLESQGLELSQVYRLYCQHSHAVFACSGSDCGVMFAKICGVDLTTQAFSSGDVAQTSMARVNVIVVNVSDEHDGSDQYLIMTDISSSQHLWDSIVDAADEF